MTNRWGMKTTFEAAEGVLRWDSRKEEIWTNFGKIRVLRILIKCLKLLCANLRLNFEVILVILRFKCTFSPPSLSITLIPLLVIV